MAEGREKVFILSLGCAKNTVDSERLKKQLLLNGFIFSNSMEEASTVIINTCGFIEAAKEESINEIFEAVRLKKEKVISRILVFGCLAGRYGEELVSGIPELDSVTGVESYAEILSFLGAAEVEAGAPGREPFGYVHSAYLKISEGCGNRCSYCAIPHIRGPYRSREPVSLFREALGLVRQGAKELVLIGQDTANYGSDIPGPGGLPELAAKILEIEGLEWLRLLYMHPAHVSDGIIALLRDAPQVCRYLDIPLQHISDRILESMNRKISSDDILRLLDKIRKEVPDAILRTTMMVGYPGESERDFDELCRFAEEYRFDRMGVFSYSREEGTESFSYEDDVPPEEKEKRKAHLLSIQSGISAEKNRQLIGAGMKVLVDEICGPDGTYRFAGRSEGHAPEVDGTVFIEAPEGSIGPGDICHVRVNGADEYDLFASLAPPRP